MKLNTLDLNKLHTFAAVVEGGGVSAAARRLALTPSAVSQSLSSLEASLGVQLFNRVGRKLVPTREGELLSTQLREYHGQLQHTLEEIVNEEREVRGLVRVGLFLGFSRLRLARLVALFIGRHPAARVKLFYGPLEELGEGLREGRLDFTFSFGPRGERSRRVRSTRLFQQQLVLVAGSRFARRRLALDDLQRLPVIDYYQADPLIHRWIAHHYRRRAVRLDVRAWAATTDLVLELVLRHAGVGVLPRDLVEPLVRSRRLVVMETDQRELGDSIWLNELKQSYPSPRLEAFRRTVLEATDDGRGF